MRFKTELNVNLTLLESNFQKLGSILKGNETIFMVKANGYGHGAVEITEFAHRELGIKEFGLASLGEAVQLRSELPADKFEAKFNVKWEAALAQGVVFNAMDACTHREQ